MTDNAQAETSTNGSRAVPAVQLFGIGNIPEATPGADVASLVIEGLRVSDLQILPGDVLIVTHKLISKAEGQLVDLREVVPSSFALQYAAAWKKDPRQVEVTLHESKRVVRMDRGILIAETHHGFICANAGVDASNVPGEEVVCLLPRDPDASARRLREALAERVGVRVPVIVTDSFGRPWRNGIVNIAIGVAGIAPVTDYRGQPDDFGRVMAVSVLAVGDELASAAELVMGKVTRCPAVIVRGYPYEPSEDATSRALVMEAGSDLFR